MELKWKIVVMSFSILALIFIFFSISSSSEDEIEDPAALKMLFHNYTIRYKKKYLDEQKKKSHFEAFKKSIGFIKHLNRRQKEELLQLDSASSFKSVKSWAPGRPKNEGAALWGLSPFADLTPTDFASTYLDKNMEIHIQNHKKRNHFPHRNEYSFEKLENGKNIGRKKRDIVPLPLKVDWRTQGIVTPVKNQRACGACWAFSTIETVESMNALKKGVLQLLSVQQVIDCSKNGNLGCNGGDTCAAVEWMSGRTVALEESYPTTLQSENCMLQSAPTGVRVNSNYTCQAFTNNEENMLKIIANHGPVTVAVDATNWQYYVGGIIQFNCDSQLNHAVQIVGYDKTGDTPHYIVRNSWGTGFGDSGYLYVGIGSNLCGIATHVASLSVA